MNKLASNNTTPHVLKSVFMDEPRLQKAFKDNIERKGITLEEALRRMEQDKIDVLLGKLNVGGKKRTTKKPTKKPAKKTTKKSTKKPVKKTAKKPVKKSLKK